MLFRPNVTKYLRLSTLAQNFENHGAFVTHIASFFGKPAELQLKQPLQIIQQPKKTYFDTPHGHNI